MSLDLCEERPEVSIPRPPGRAPKCTHDTAAVVVVVVITDVTPDMQ